MLIFINIAETNDWVKRLRSQGKTIGFIPTMGALHAGHLALIQRSVAENDFTVSSIFVNPVQFNNPEDLKKYPREADADIQKLTEAGCDLLFMPSEAEIYPEPPSEIYDFGHLDKVMEGKFRPGHFNGVAVVVRRLFDIILPHRAYFGEKDFQQLVIIQHMVRQYHLPVEIIPCATVREPDGLAMSSRNKRLTSEERKIAPAIYQILCEAKEKASQIDIAAFQSWAEQRFRDFPALRPEYFEIADAATLLPVSDWKSSKRIVACVAAFLGNVRLIDNLILIS